ncbi:MAG: hypothetical protein CVV07_07310 [Gammaproteobacteria bacterium HGW-Gammaproteobacteria-11]|nr:MAG: hypothetical protein CVV07_07310 [Gammaproteobacteria bacterium HGW-Gammaproteobacteria-11]
MIKPIDDLLLSWAETQRMLLRGEPIGPQAVKCSLAAAIDSKGVVIPATTRGGCQGDPYFPVTDLVVNQLREDLRRVVYEHYLLHPGAYANNARALGYGCVRSYYNALDTAHEHVRQALSVRLAA